MAFNEHNINAAIADVSTDQPTVKKNTTIDMKQKSLNQTSADVSTDQPTANKKVTLIFSENNLKASNTDIEKVPPDYYGTYTLRELPQPGNVYTPVETQLKVPYNVPEITDYAPELLFGVTYSELEQLEADVPELSLIRDAQNRITGVQINDIVIDVKT